MKVQDRNQLIDAYNRQASDLDRHLLTLASGSLVLSVAFTANVLDDAEWIGLLLASWLAFILSATAVILSYGSSAKKAGDEVTRLTKELEGTADGSWKPAKTWVKVWNFLAKYLLLGGLALFATFAAVNLLCGEGSL